MTGAVWRLQWAVALRRRRLLLWNLLVPALLLVPVALSGAAAVHKAVVFTLFFAFFGAYGSCIPLIRDGGSGWAEKVLLTGYGARPWLVERLLASAALDWAQLVPVTLVLVWLASGSPTDTAAILTAQAVALLFANLLGIAVAAVVKSLAEAALGCAIVCLVALHLAGVFRAPTVGTWAETASQLSPFRPLLEVWRSTLRDGITGLSVSWLPPLALAAALALFVLAAGVIGRRTAENRAV
ncbi:MAG: ABC transporter permease [Gemmatimonadota bacterium]